MTTESKIEQLKAILTARLPLINRWLHVDVTQQANTFTIIWSGAKIAGNTHPIETKEIPLKDLDIIINRNVDKLKNEVTNYK
jgi:hypothetical protein